MHFFSDIWDKFALYMVQKIGVITPPSKGAIWNELISKKMQKSC